jgi:serine/threonine protein kinase
VKGTQARPAEMASPSAVGSLASSPTAASITLTQIISDGKRGSNGGGSTSPAEPSLLGLVTQGRAVRPINCTLAASGCGCQLMLLWKRMQLCISYVDYHVDRANISAEAGPFFENMLQAFWAIVDSYALPSNLLRNMVNSSLAATSIKDLSTSLQSALMRWPVPGLCTPTVFNPRLDVLARAVDRYLSLQLLNTFKGLPQCILDAKLNTVEAALSSLSSPPKGMYDAVMRSQCGLSHMRNSYARKLNSVFRNRRLHGLKLEQLAKSGQRPMQIIDTELGTDEADEQEITTAVETDVGDVLLDDVFIHANLNDDVGFGNTYRDIWNGAVVCVKRMNSKDFIGGMFGMLQASQMLQLSLNGKKSEFINCILVACVHHEIGYLVSPLAPLGSMQELFLTEPRDAHPLEASQKVSIWLDVISGINFLHSNGIVHGRLKASNVLMFNNYRAKLCDFGVNSYLTTESTHLHKGIDGVRWMAPELVVEELNLNSCQSKWLASINAQNETVPYTNDNKKPSKKGPYETFDTTLKIESCLGPFGPRFAVDSSVDIYAFGLVIVALETRRKPFHNIELVEGVISALERGDQYFMPGVYKHKVFLRPDIEEWVNKCQSRESLHRPTAQTLVPAFEALLLRVVSQELEKLRLLRQRKLDGVLAEVADLKKKLKDVTTIVNKGTDLITKRQVP